MNGEFIARAVRLGRIVVAALVLSSALAARQFILPGGASACDCAGPVPGAPIFSGAEEAVFVGTAGQPQPDGTYRFAVERWFVGGDAAEINVTSERQPTPGGGMAVNTCGLHFEVGDRVLLTASIAANAYSPGLCLPHAVVASAEGQQLLAAAIDQFGEGKAPGASTGQDPGGGIDLAALALGAVGLVVVVALGAVIVGFARRGPSSEEVAP